MIYHKNKESFVDVCHGVFGRKVIKSPIKEINAANVVQELGKALILHWQNRREIDYLYHYMNGNQPIIYREKQVRPEIKNNVVENHALEIVRFMMAQSFGEPIQYVSVDKDEAKTQEIDQLNKMMAAIDKSYYDIQIGEWQSNIGTAYRYNWSNLQADISLGECPVGIDVPDPRYNFVVYSSDFGSRPLMSVSQVKDEENENVYYCTTPKQVYYIKNSTIIPEKSAVNGYGRIMLVEFPNNVRRLSDIEIVITMLDALNKVQSNRMDGIEQFVQAFMKFVNCEIDEDDFLKMCQLGAIKIKGQQGVQADVDVISNELNQEQTQVAKDDLYKNMLIIEGMPNREQNTGGDTGQAVYLRNGWDFAEQRAKIDEPVIIKSEKEALKNVLTILRTKQLISPELKISDIDVKITRNKTDNMLVKAQALIYLLEKGIHPKIAIKTCDLWGDPEKVYVQSKPYLDAIYKTAQELQADEERKAAQAVSLAQAQSKSPPEGGERIV